MLGIEWLAVVFVFHESVEKRAGPTVFHNTYVCILQVLRNRDNFYALKLKMPRRVSCFKNPLGGYNIKSI